MRDELCQINDIIPNSLQNNSYDEKSSSRRLKSYFELQEKGLLTSLINLTKYQFVQIVAYCHVPFASIRQDLQNN